METTQTNNIVTQKRKMTTSISPNQVPVVQPHQNKPTRSSPYPLRIRQPKRQWESLATIRYQQEERDEPINYYDAIKSRDAHL